MELKEGYPLSADGWISFSWDLIRARFRDVYRGVAVLVSYQILLYLIDLLPGGMVFSTVIQLSIGLVLSVGWLNYCLAIVRGDPVSINDIFAAFGRFADVWIVSIGLSLLISVGLLLFIIPGIYLLIRFGLCLLAVVDRGLPPLGSFRFSDRITRGYRPQLTVIYLIAIGLYALAVFPLIAGFQQFGIIALIVYNFVVTPMVSLTIASAYDSLVVTAAEPSFGDKSGKDGPE